MGADMKTSDPNHPKSLYMVYNPAHGLHKMMGSISLKFLVSHQTPSKCHI